MEKLNYSEFVRYLSENIPAAMGPAYAGAEVTADPVAKLGSTYKGLSIRLPGQKAAILSYIDPLVAVFASVLLLGERMTLLQVAGGCLILGFTLWNEIGS